MKSWVIMGKFFLVNKGYTSLNLNFYQVPHFLKDSTQIHLSPNENLYY